MAIVQCDQKAFYFLDEQRKTYLVRSPDEELSRHTIEATPESDETVDITVTTDSLDTGERRQVGGYSARHIKTTTTIEPGEDDGIKASTTQIDGWYIDLPRWNCRDDARQERGVLLSGMGHKHPRFIFRQIGTARRGFAIEETTTKSESGVTTTSKTEFVEISEAPLDASLFEVPPDHSRVTPMEP